ncbi:MAG TPA: pyridine nucleotide-disulfide oxidoreductase, partial [Candidatus Hydrogenedentes bacterium]|nr:pyridine nucleotide-disulfide oxidoreductase [Candidatus Hydrogenedentota bacterium]
MMAEISKAWICLVCGYVHYGDTPPETCPVCGAPATDFELHTTKAAPAKNETRKWRCVICGYEHDGDSPCKSCPLCGASRNDFEPVEPTAPSDIAGQELNSRKIVIIGGGIAGVSAAEHARLTAPHADIVLYAKEPEPPYYRLNLTRYLAGEVDAEALPVHPAQWY